MFEIEFYRKVLVHGFTKKTRKTPQSELEKAQKYRADYDRQHSAERKD